MESVTRTFLPLGLVSFGGPTGQVGLLERLFVEKFRVVSAEKFAEQLGVCMAIPGSTSLQMAMCMGGAITGTAMGSVLGGVLFSLPGLILMLFVGKYADVGSYITEKIYPEWIYAAAVSILIVASLTMFQRICKTTLSVIITVISAAITLSIPYQYIPLVPLGSALIATFLTTQATVSSLGLGTRLTVGTQPPEEKTGFSFTSAQISLGLFLLLSLAAFFLGRQSDLTRFFLAGSSLAGGGTAVLPYLHQISHQIDPKIFLLLFSVALVSPGPIYNLAAAVGVVLSGGSLLYGLSVWLAVVLPGVLLMHILLPSWTALKTSYEPLSRAILGLNAAAVGVLVAGTVQLFLGTIGLQWTRIFACLIAVALQAIWEIEPVFVVLLGLATSLVHGFLLA